MGINLFGLVLTYSQLGLIFNLFASLGWLAQSIWLYIPKTNPSHPRNVTMVVDKQNLHYKKQIWFNFLWLVLLCVGFLLQLL